MTQYRMRRALAVFGLLVLGVFTLGASPALLDLIARVEVIEEILFSEPPRFEDCGDGTVADHQTGLQWEQKTGTVGSIVRCDTTDCPDPHIVNNVYEWSNAVATFLPQLNGEFDPDAGAGCFTDRCNWRLPKISELQTILIGPESAPGQATICSDAPCIDPAFASVGGPTVPRGYWSASTVAGDPNSAWAASFKGEGSVLSGPKTNDGSVRAVRGGSCD